MQQQFSLKSPHLLLKNLLKNLLMMQNECVN